MKTKLSTNTIGSMLVLILLSATVTTCDRQEDDPFYVGTWQYKEKVYAGEFAYIRTGTSHSQRRPLKKFMSCNATIQLL